jgi:hypothetical protein
MICRRFLHGSAIDFANSHIGDLWLEFKCMPV